MHAELEAAVAAWRDPSSRAAVRAHVEAPARLHLGFLDPSGTLGRRYGSLGLIVDGTRDGRRARTRRGGPLQRADAGTAERAAHAPATTCTHCAAPPAATRRVHLHSRRRCRRMPASARARSSRSRWATPSRQRSASGWTAAHRDAARAAALRSGVGIAGFDPAGLLLDGGPRADGSPAAADGAARAAAAPGA